MSPRSSPYAACFRPSDTDDRPSPPSPPPPPMSSQSNLTTALYQTPTAAFSLTWSRSLFSRSLHLHSDRHHSFLLHLNPFSFWNKSGSKHLAASLRLFWDFSRARFGSGPEPRSGFFIALLLDNQIILLVGDLVKEAYARTKSLKPKIPQSLVLKREQVVARKIYSTRARIGGKIRDIQIDCGYNDDTRLCFAVDGVKALEIKHLKWKFRGNEKIEVEGVPVQISWDVYNWVFSDDKDQGHAIFMFRFDGEEEEEEFLAGGTETRELWSVNNQSRRMRMSSSSSSLSISSVGSSAGSSSVLDWATVEESELGGGPSAFSLLVYAWKK